MGPQRAGRPWMALVVAAIGVIAVPATAFASGAGAGTDFHSRQRGVVVLGSIDFTSVGDALLGHVGGQWSEIEALPGGKWLLQWDGLVTLTGGVLGQTHPYTPMLGVRASGFFEGGWRMRPARPWSLYLGGRLALKGVVMPPWGTSLGALATVNNVAGVGGAALGGGLRIDAGASWLSGRHGLLATAFVGESGRLPQTNLSGAAFTDLGAMVRFDAAGAWMLSGEALWGTTPAIALGPPNRSDQTTHVGFAVDCRKIFGNGMWLALRVSDDVESDFITYGGSGATYHTRNAPTLGARLLFGVGIGPQS